MLTQFTDNQLAVNDYTNQPFMETHFREKMVSINGYGFPLKGYGFPLHGNFWQNLKSCFQPKNQLQGSQNQQTFQKSFKQIKHQKQSLYYSNMPCFSKMVSINDNGFPLKGYGQGHTRQHYLPSKKISKNSPSNSAQAIYFHS